MRVPAVVLLAASLASASGGFAAGGAELLRIRGTAFFRWDFHGADNADPGDNMGFGADMDWLPRLNGSVDGQFGLKFCSVGGVELGDLFLNLHLGDNLTLRGGQFVMPFGYAYTLSSAAMPFARRAAVTAAPEFSAYGGRDVGACVAAHLAPVTLDLVLSNGTGGNAVADNGINKRFTARLIGKPAEWLDLGASAAVIGQPEAAGGEEPVAGWNGLGLDVFAAAEYPLDGKTSLLFSGEYMSLGYAGPQVEGIRGNSAGALILTAAAVFETGAGTVRSVRPAVRFETFSPMSYTIEGGEDPKDDGTTVDFCLNLNVFSPDNTLQLGGRNRCFENENKDGYTDFYVGWRMNF